MERLPVFMEGHAHESERGRYCGSITISRSRKSEVRVVYLWEATGLEDIKNLPEDFPITLSKKEATIYTGLIRGVGNTFNEMEDPNKVALLLALIDLMLTTIEGCLEFAEMWSSMEKSIPVEGGTMSESAADQLIQSLVVFGKDAELNLEVITEPEAFLTMLFGDM